MTQRFFYDTEFLEGSQKRRIFGFELPSVFDTHKTIDLISIGLVSEDGNREYYAISKDFNLKEAWNRYDIKTTSYDVTGKIYWIRENVLKSIWCDLFKIHGKYPEKIDAEYAWDKMKNYQKYLYLKLLLLKYGKTNKQIAEEIEIFIGSKNTISNFDEINLKTELYAYYSAYDHVALSWLYGKMINLPKGFPMYTIDLKQELDRKLNKKKLPLRGYLPYPNSSLDNKIKEIACYPNYPKQTDEHNALSDARFNRELYLFLKSL